MVVFSRKLVTIAGFNGFKGFNENFTFFFHFSPELFEVTSTYGLDWGINGPN